MLASEKEELQVNETLRVTAILFLFPWQVQTQFPLQSMSWSDDTSMRVLQEAALTVEEAARLASTDNDFFTGFTRV